MISGLTSCNSNGRESNASGGYPDLLLTQATLVTPDSTATGFNIAVVDGKIVSLSKVEIPTDDHTQIISLKDAFVYAGFIDAHAHLMSYGKGLFSVDLRGTSSWAEVVERTVTFAKEHPELEAITGRGWDQNDWKNTEFPTNDTLNTLFPNIQVVLTRIDGHAVIANEAALNASDYSGKAVEGGSVILQNGQPTGVLLDNAIDLLNLPAHSVEFESNALLTAESNCFKAGLTSIADAGMSVNQIELVDSLQTAQALRLPIYAMVMADTQSIEYFLELGPIKTNRLSVRSFKFMGDGALGSRGARLLQPYHDHPHESGFLLHSPEFFISSAQKLAEAGFQMNTHAIGDSTNRLLLEVYKQHCTPSNNLRWRIEHAQVVHPSDVATFGEHGIIPSIQPTHATSDMYWAEERLGEDRIHHAYAYNDLLKSAGIVALGTDFPIEDIDPLKTFYAAVVRKDASGFPEDGFQSENALSREDALRGMTEWAAYANFQENEKGSIAVGNYADFTILDSDLLRCEQNQILNSTVLYTIVQGDVVYMNPKYLHDE